MHKKLNNDYSQNYVSDTHIHHYRAFKAGFKRIRTACVGPYPWNWALTFSL